MLATAIAAMTDAQLADYAERHPRRLDALTAILEDIASVPGHAADEAGDWDKDNDGDRFE
ncbi:MAG TPA: hypothetical protein VEA69_16630 [Tepidisphaeraceae bacterium]|nr:hypothetical protein [Tepidisphaeraceae bacterium]